MDRRKFLAGTAVLGAGVALPGTLVLPAAAQAAAGDEAMGALQSKWYNVVVASLGLDPRSFQLTQSSVPLPDTSGGIWEVFNSVPPESLTQTFSQGSPNRFYDNWQSVANTLLPQGDAGGQFRTVMGDKMRDWNAYKLKETPTDMLAAFKRWADIHLDSGKASRAKTLFLQMQNNVVTKAAEAANNPDYVDPDYGPKFSKNIDDLRAALVHGKSADISFNSAQASSDLSHTWANAKLGGFFKFFSGSAGGGSDEINLKAQRSSVTVQAKLGRVVSFSAVPAKWFVSGALSIAYNNKNNLVWPAGQKPDWNDAFGPAGNLKRYATELVAYDGLDVTITSSASYSKSEQETIRAAAKVGFWPFFSAKGSGGSENVVTFNDNGDLTVKMHSELGNPAILGVNVRSIDKLFS